MKLRLLGVLPLALLPQCVTATADPKPVLVMTEWIDWGGPGHPWPIELRLAVYDNGMIIRQPERGDPRTKPRFTWEQRTPAEALALAAEAKAARLENVQITDESVSRPLHDGITNIQYWDADTSRFVKLTAWGRPCTQVQVEAWKEEAALVRSATDPRFLRLCETLLNLPEREAMEWQPKAMTVELFAMTDRPDRIVPWPNNWPKEWRKSVAYGLTHFEVCVPVGPRPDPLTAQILDPQSEVWSKSVAVGQVGSEWLVVQPFGSRIAMPAAFDGWPGPCSGAGPSE